MIKSQLTPKQITSLLTFNMSLLVFISPKLKNLNDFYILQIWKDREIKLSLRDESRSQRQDFISI